MNGSASFMLRAMRYADIPQVVAIDEQAFATPWSTNVYRYEIDQNPLSSMAVIVLGEPQPTPQPTGLAGLLARLRHREPDLTHFITGYGGFWFSQRRAHISTIAVHPEWRGHSLGEALLAGMVRRALNMEAHEVTLEVRVSNAPALALYQKYGFTPFGIKRRYYRDNGEDAYDMRISPVDERYRAHFETRWNALHTRLSFEDDFSAVPSQHLEF